MQEIAKSVEKIDSFSIIEYNKLCNLKLVINQQNICSILSTIKS